LSCSSKSKFKVDWNNIDLLEMLKTDSIVGISEKLNVSDMTIRKRLKKLQ
jgi:DNA-binding Lrp family transcriptional regulator